MPRFARRALIGAGTSAAALVVLWAVAFHFEAARDLDLRVLRDLVDARTEPVRAVAHAVGSLFDVRPFGAMALALIVLTALRRGRRVATGAAALILGAVLTTQALKPLLADTRLVEVAGDGITVGTASWPSGHTAAVTSLAAAAVLAMPRGAARTAVAVAGGGLSLAVGFSLVILGWHFPSDVIAGALVAAGWAGPAWALARTPRARRIEDRDLAPAPASAH